MKLPQFLLGAQNRLDYTIEKMPEIVDKLRDLSPFVEK